jgi:50S ribosomal protein L16 3-hydroxylase
MLFSDWFSAINAEEFRKTAFERIPHAEPRVARQAIPFLNWESLTRMLASPTSPDVMVARSGALQKVDPPRDAASFEKLFRDGSSIVIRQAEKHDPAIRLIADAFESQFAAPATIQIFATPAGNSGFGWHYDCEDVFLAQTAGTKEFFIRRNTVNPQPHIDRMPRDMHYEREISKPISSTLMPGDWLYIPSGWWHMARAEEDSLSISVGVLMPRAGGTRLS